MVIATQNPVEFEGTYPLPESQLDRFLLRIPMGYPAREVEMQVLASHRLGEPVDSLQPVLSCQQIVGLQEEVRRVEIEDSIQEYLLDIVEATRNCEQLHTVSAPAAPWPCIALRRRRPWWPAAATSCPMTSSPWPSPSWPIASSAGRICTAIIANRSRP